MGCNVSMDNATAINDMFMRMVPLGEFLQERRESRQVRAGEYPRPTGGAGIAGVVAARTRRISAVPIVGAAWNGSVNLRVDSYLA